MGGRGSYAADLKAARSINRGQRNGGGAAGFSASDRAVADGLGPMGDDIVRAYRELLADPQRSGFGYSNPDGVVRVTDIGDVLGDSRWDAVKAAIRQLMVSNGHRDDYAAFTMQHRSASITGTRGARFFDTPLTVGGEKIDYFAIKGHGFK